MTPDSATETRIYREQALDELNIGKTTFYKWVNYLELEQRQDSAKRKYLDESQFNQLQVLQAYYKEKGTIEGFLPTENLTDHPGQLVKANENAISSEDRSAPRAEISTNLRLSQCYGVSIPKRD
jgi:hypothetical protein